MTVWSALIALGAAALLAGRRGVLWGHGLPVGHDFHIYYAAARASADGRLAEIFVPEQLWGLAQQYLGTAFATNGLWLYPPHYLLLIAPLAWLPYVAAYLTFSVATLTAYLAAARSLGLGWRWLALLVLAPTTLFTVLAGQNGLLTGALLVGGVGLMTSRPSIAGVLIGLLTIKPHLGLLVLVTLAATRAWRTTIVAILTAVGLAALATAFYGLAAWTLPFEQTFPSFARGMTTVPEYWATGFTSVFAQAAIVLGPGWAAWGIQVAFASLAAAATWRVCRRSSEVADRVAVVGIGTILTFPYLFFYDLPMATLAAALYAQAKSRLSTFDQLLLAALAFLPVFVIGGVPLLALGVALVAFLRIWWRVEHDPASGTAGATTRGHPAHGTARAWLEQVDLVPALLVLACVVVYANGLPGHFILDDQAAIVTNASAQSLGGWLSPPRDTPIAGRPVVALTFALNHAVGGLDVIGYRLINIAIHAMCALLLAGVVARTLALPRFGQFRNRANCAGFTVAVLWAVHPLNSEAVNYVTQRTESLMALFYLLTLYASIRSATSQHPGRWHLLAGAACVLGMGCKETMATAPLVVALYDRVFLFTSWRDAFNRRWPLYAALASSWLLLGYLLLQGPRAGATGFSTGVAPVTYLLNQAAMVTRYLRLALWPDALVVNYGPPVPLVASDVWPQLLLVGSLLGLTAAALGRWPALGFLGAWFFITLAPSSSIVPIATQAGAERRMYLPLMAVVALLVVGARSFAWPRARAVQIGVVLALVFGLGAATMARNREYASPLLLAETVLERWPTDVAHGMVGAELVRVRQDDVAVAHLRLGARSDPTARYNLGAALFNTKRFDEAIQELEILVAQYPLREEVPWSRRLIGQAHAVQGRWPEAVTEFRAVLAMTPHDAEAKRALLDVLVTQGVQFGRANQHQAAAEVFRQAVAVDPAGARIRSNLVSALLESGDLASAVHEAQTAVAVNRQDPVSHDLLGRALALQGHYADAIAALEEAERLRPSDPTILEDLRRVRAASTRAIPQEP